MTTTKRLKYRISKLFVNTFPDRGTSVGELKAKKGGLIAYEVLSKDVDSCVHLEQLQTVRRYLEIYSSLFPHQKQRITTIRQKIKDRHKQINSSVVCMS